MIRYFMPTSRKILGTLILVLLLSATAILPFLSDQMSYITGQKAFNFGTPMTFVSLQGAQINNLNIVNLLIDIVIFYLAICVLSIIFKGRKDNNVPNSDSGRGNTSPTNEAKP